MGLEGRRLGMRGLRLELQGIPVSCRAGGTRSHEALQRAPGSKSSGSQEFNETLSLSPHIAAKGLL